MISQLEIPSKLANQLSCITGVSLWTSVLAIVWRRLQVAKLREAIWIGVGWFIATMMFETFFLNRKLTWSQILHTYDVSEGEFWGLVVLWIGVMPIVAYLLKTSHHALKD